jgi:hypothetical protein
MADIPYGGCVMGDEGDAHEGEDQSVDLKEQGREERRPGLAASLSGRMLVCIVKCAPR